MYEQAYGLLERPFGLTWNPRYFLETPAHEEALSTLQYGLLERKGLIVLVGEPGTGKTTLIRALMSRVRADRLVLVNNPLLTRTEFFQLLVQGFALSEDAASSKPRLLAELADALREHVSTGADIGLIVDDAHALPLDILEEIRYLANIEIDEGHGLPIVLSGQRELDDRLNRPALRALKQRVTLRCVLDPLQMDGMSRYIAGRIRAAGGAGTDLFSAEALDLIHRVSGGVPRLINTICDNALLTGFAVEESAISRDTVLEVCRDLNLDVPKNSEGSAGERRESPLVPGGAPGFVPTVVRPLGAGSFRRLFF